MLDPEHLRSAEDAGLTVICGSVAFDDTALAALGIDAQADGDAIVRVAVSLAQLFDVDLHEAAASLADHVQQLRWFEEDDAADAP